MIYRIDIQHFLTHAIDHFSLGDLLNMKYVIISAKVSNTGKSFGVVKINELYPYADTIILYADTMDKTTLRESYMSLLRGDDYKNEISNPIENAIYTSFVNMLLLHHNVCIVCDQSENAYIDILSEFLNDTYGIDVIDLNQLFTEGKVGPLYIDRKDIRDKAVDIRRRAAKALWIDKSSTTEGKEAIIKDMSKKEKLRMLKNFGIKIRKQDMDKIDKILLEEWVIEDGNDEE